MVRVPYALGGLAFLAMGTALSPSRERRKRARAVPAIGRIVEIELQHYDEGGHSYHPVVEFTAGPDDQLVRGARPPGSGRGWPRGGSTARASVRRRRRGS
jgi:hypothetical protein